MKVDQIGPERLSVFPHQKPSVGGSLTLGGQPPAGGEVVVPKNGAPPSMGFYRKVRDTEGNVVGLHALAWADASCRQIVQYIRARRLTTARQLASWLEVSQRTIYRDIQDLSLSGVPIEGEGAQAIGWAVSLRFGRSCLSSMKKGAGGGLRMVESWGGPALAAASRAAPAKVSQALPVAWREEVERSRVDLRSADRL